MMDSKIIDYFSQFMSLSSEGAQAIIDNSQVTTFKKGTLLLKEGEIAKDTYLVLEGCIRQYYMIDGEEKTSNFFTENQWVIAFNSFGEPAPSKHFFCCAEDTTAIVGNEAQAQPLYERFPEFVQAARAIVEKEFARQQEFMASYVTDSPEQRYLKLVENRPQLVQRIPQYQLASYIGVKPESLSRIRKRLFNKR